METIASAMARVEEVMVRRPSAGLHDDAPAFARWHGDTRMVVRHASGAEVETDMPEELGGSGDRVSPGWLFRAGLASCAATCIAMHAARSGIALDRLEVQAASRSDTRGLLGLAGEGGEPMGAGPVSLGLEVRIAAAGVSAERLRALVADAWRCSPVPSAVRDGTPVALTLALD